MDLDLDTLGLTETALFSVHDLLSDERYSWQGSRNFVRLDPNLFPVHVFRLG